ncbi:hypothetical protein [Oceanobacillus luteolus]|uniref:KTSC domain-containing protein n=1 Tax=Oceanobacillus luteolus TaxID=1274358 RepID=A0ABW4HW83_9BACI
MSKVAQVYDFTTGKEMVGITETNRKTFHVMKDGTMTSYFSQNKKSRLKDRARRALGYFFDLED